MTAEPMTDVDRLLPDAAEALNRAMYEFPRSPPAALIVGYARVVLEAARPIIDAERSRADAAEAERDAAVARAMPEPVLVRTMEEVGALTTGAYRIAAPWQPRRWILGWRHPPGTWTLLIDMGASGVMDDHIVGSWVQRLPDLPTPTEGETRHV